MTLTMISYRLRLTAGWMAVGLSTAVLCFWAIIVAREAFHEGWYDRYLWRNALLTIAQYLNPALVLFLPMCVALRWRRIAFLAFLLPAIVSVFFFHNGADRAYVAIPLIILGTLFQFGNLESRRWAWRTTITLPLLTAAVTAAPSVYTSILRRPHPEDGRIRWSDITWKPVTLDRNIEEHARLMVSVRLNGAGEPAVMQLDLGTPSTVVYPAAYRQLVGKSRARVSGSLSGTIASHQFQDEPFGFRSDEPEPSSKNEPVLLGTIGNSFFEHRILILDFVRQRLAIIGKGADLPSARRAIEYLPLTYRYRHIFVPATLNGSKETNLLFDTGSSMIPLFTGRKRWGELTGRGLGDPSNSTVRVDSWGKQAVLISAPMKGSFCIGSACIVDPAVYCESSRLPNLDLDRYPFIASGLFGNVPFDGRFTVIVDISGRRFGLYKGSLDFPES